MSYVVKARASRSIRGINAQLLHDTHCTHVSLRTLNPPLLMVPLRYRLRFLLPLFARSRLLPLLPLPDVGRSQRGFAPAVFIDQFPVDILSGTTASETQTAVTL